jgi:hypothetical protein
MNMARIRFSTARDLFDSFPTVRQDVDAEPDDSHPLQYLRSLVAAGRLKQAAGFCAYLLPRREAVWWGCRSFKSLTPKMPSEEAPLLKAAEEWVGLPEEEQRIAALELGMRSNPNWPSTWLALAAGWSGGNVLLGMQATAQAPPQQTARAVRAALLTAVAYVAPPERTRSLMACIQDGIRIADDQDA